MARRLAEITYDGYCGCLADRPHRQFSDLPSEEQVAVASEYLPQLTLELPELLAQYKRESGKTHYETAEMLGVSASKIYIWRHGSVDPGQNVWWVMADAIGLLKWVSSRPITRK